MIIMNLLLFDMGGVIIMNLSLFDMGGVIIMNLSLLFDIRDCLITVIYFHLI